MDSLKIENCTLKQIISANKNIINNIELLEEKLSFITGFTIKSGKIKIKYKDKKSNRNIYDIYQIDENGKLVSLSKNNSKDNETKILEYKKILQSYFKIYNELKQTKIYTIPNTNLKVYVDLKGVILYKETNVIKDDILNVFYTDFHIFSFDGNEIRFNKNLNVEFDIDEILELQVSQNLPKVFTDNIKPISVISTSDSNIYKVVKYSKIKEKIDNVSKKIKRKTLEKK